MSTNKKQETALNEIPFALGSVFLGTTYLQKFIEETNKNTGEITVKVWVHGENQMEQLIVKDIPVTKQELRDLEDAPLHAIIEFKNLVVKFYGSASGGGFAETKTTCKAGGIEVVKTSAGSKPVTNNPAQNK
jgi:hypothetical protein